MTDRPDLESLARSIIDTNLYMVLGTADEGGQPWVAPVYYAPIDDRQFVWVSRPEARHSQHLAVRAEVAIVIFDSSAEIGTGCGVYMSAVAETLTGSAAEVAVEAYSRRALAHGGRAWTTADVESAAPFRLYCATAEAIDVLDEHDRRVPVDLSDH